MAWDFKPMKLILTNIYANVVGHSSISEKEMKREGE